MRSIIQALQCKCGCNIPVNPLLEKVFTHLNFNYTIGIILGVDCKAYPEGTMPHTVKLTIEGARTQQELMTSLTACLKKRFKNYLITVHTHEVITIQMGVIGQNCVYGEDATTTYSVDAWIEGAQKLKEHQDADIQRTD